MGQLMRRAWQALPWDGQGWGQGDDPDLARLRAWAAAGWRRRRAPLWRLPLRAADRTLWGVAALWQSWIFARSRGLGPVATIRLYQDCLLAGASAMDAHVWRALHATRHPLPPRVTSLLLTSLGEPAAHALLRDKLGTATRLTMAGIAFPVLHGLIRRGEIADPDRLALAGPARLFIKPRHGHGGRDACAVQTDGREWRLNGRSLDKVALAARLTRSARTDELLVQEWLAPPSDWADLAVLGRVPVLRLTTARTLGGAPFLHSALLILPVPDADPRRFLKGAVYVPVDPGTGRLTAGLMLNAPRHRLDRLPWNGAPLAGRAVPGFDRAVAMALAAMAALPPLPLVNWDFVPTQTGPVLLEGNSAGNWILTNLAGVYGLDAGPLPPLLAGWLAGIK